MDETEVPSHFLCPISMELMRDPVTITTGITYNRESIEKWLFSCKKKVCPMTKQELSDSDLTPNHTVRRLIQAWCTINASNGIERIPTPKPPVNKSHILKLINEAKKSSDSQTKCLQRLGSIAQGSQSNKICLESAGAVEFLASLIKKKGSGNSCDEALNILHHLDISDIELKKLLGNSNDGSFVDSLIEFLKFGNYQSRAYSIILLKSTFSVADPIQLIGAKYDLFIEIIHILKDQISEQASKAALKLLMELCPWGRNKIKAVETGAIRVLIELLMEITDRRRNELMLTVLDQLCRCAEGRAELLNHAAGLATVSKKILRVSHVGTDRGVRILSSISKFSATSRVLQEMLQVGVVAKLCLVLQVDSNPKTVKRSKEILSLHSRVWKDSPCIPPHLLSFYPSSS